MEKGKLLFLVGLIGFMGIGNCAFAQASDDGKMRYRITAVQSGNEDVWSMSNIAEVIPAMTVFVPNAFSPNEDGLNEEFKVKGRGIKSCKIQIYDRWGQKIYEGDKLDEGWDGTYKGKVVESNAYLYQVSAIGHGGGARHISGSVTLLR
ncbi:MAG: gliding motility-associated C-terminal domain-containing protein [Bacteroidia bacterium]